MNPQDVIAAILPGALASQAGSSIPAGFTIAQCALETGWLKVIPPGNNLFGIKADPSWTGPTVEEWTHETIDGVRELIQGKFRAYPDYASSIIDHGNFLVSNPRYASCFSTTDSDAFAEAVAAAGYATDPNYAATICSIIHSHNLTQYDNPST
jgi:flagellar protein FlgJ